MSGWKKNDQQERQNAVLATAGRGFSPPFFNPAEDGSQFLSYQLDHDEIKARIVQKVDELRRTGEMQRTAMAYSLEREAAAAFTQAREQALQAGLSVHEVVDGQLVETHADGSQTVIKPMPAPLAVTPGARRRLLP
ncbi:hypothetical protein V8J88_01280 [Massilia sp. W12]|uniref:hypothetical protein n=1 Tax=Massilia sp. W12 TaxID=3126507 RepID=UPI0030D5A55A